MVRWTRSGRINGKKYLQAIQWAKELVEWSNAKYSGKLTVYIDCFGEFGTIRFFRDYESLAEVEKRMETILADQEYLQRAAKAMEMDLFIEGSLTDTVMASL